MEYTIICSACGGHVSEGGLEAFPDWKANDVLAHAAHNPGCNLSHPKRDAPMVKVKMMSENGISIKTYTIYPGEYLDAEMILE